MTCDTHPPGDIVIGPMRSCETNQVVPWGSDGLPTGIEPLKGSHIWICGGCGTFLTRDFADDDFRPLTWAEYGDWRDTLKPP